MKGPYEDILHLQRPVNLMRPRMTNRQRAAQFAPFAALTGYDAAVQETARLTETRRELDESEQDVLNERLIRAARSGEEVLFTWFVADLKKAGGTYVHHAGRIRRIEPVSGTIFLTDGRTIPVAELYQIDFPEGQNV